MHMFHSHSQFALKYPLREWRLRKDLLDRTCTGSEHAAECGSLEEPLFMQLVIPLSDRGGPLYRQVYLGLRQAILSGALPANGRLPSTRDLADQVGISRTVVLLAYDQLFGGGFCSWSQAAQEHI
jgi:hypothetical protein